MVCGPAGGRVSAIGFSLFDTPIGSCGIVWGAAGLRGVALPEEPPGRTRSRLGRRHPEAREAPPPPVVADAIGRIVAVVSGQGGDALGDLRLDMAEVGPFDRDVYAITRTIRPGETATYGEMSGRLGGRNLARAIGQALGRNPFPIVVPCHRVLAAGGRLGGFSAHGGIGTKVRLLQIEQARTGAEPLLFQHLSAAPRGP